jgi:hypothetical protein
MKNENVVPEELLDKQKENNLFIGPWTKALEEENVTDTTQTPDQVTGITKDDIISVEEAVATFTSFMNKISQTSALPSQISADIGRVEKGTKAMGTKKLRQSIINNLTLSISCILTGAFGALALFTKDLVFPQPTLIIGFACGLITTIGLAIDGLVEDRY